MRIISFDPGGTTGIAFFDSDLDLIESWQSGNVEHHAWYEAVVHENKPDIVVCENFEWRAHHGRKVELISREYIGVLKLLSILLGFKLELQSPATGKAFWTDDKIKRLSLWSTGSPHANDAVRHLLTYITMTMNDYRYIERLRND